MSACFRACRSAIVSSTMPKPTTARNGLARSPIFPTPYSGPEDFHLPSFQVPPIISTSGQGHVPVVTVSATVASKISYTGGIVHYHPFFRQQAAENSFAGLDRIKQCKPHSDVLYSFQSRSPGMTDGRYQAPSAVPLAGSCYLVPYMYFVL